VVEFVYLASKNGVQVETVTGPEVR